MKKLYEINNAPSLRKRGLGEVQKCFIYALFFVFAAIPAFAADEHQAIADFMRAADFYKQAKYSEAISTYQKALDEGFESGELYYNLGNAYYRDGKMGKAVLNYERAQQLIPHDRDLKFNYRYLLGRQPDISSDQPKNFVEIAINKHIDFYTLNEMAVILCVLFVLLSFVWLAAFQWRWQRSTVMMFSALLVLSIGIYAAGFALKIVDVCHKAVAIKKTSAKFEPRAEATEHFQLPEGTVVKILKQEGGWAKVQRGDKKLGWVPTDSVEKVRP